MTDTRIQPRMLTQANAAKYCGISVPTFVAICPVKRTQLRTGLMRYDIRKLDAWLDSIGGIGTSERPVDPDALLDSLYPPGEVYDGKRGTRQRTTEVCR